MYVWGYCLGGIWPFEREFPNVSLLVLLFSSDRTFFVYYTALNDSILDTNFRESAEPPHAFTAVSTPAKTARCLRTSFASLLRLMLCSQCTFMMFVYCSPVAHSLVAFLYLKLASSAFSFPSPVPLSFYTRTLFLSPVAHPKVTPGAFVCPTSLLLCCCCHLRFPSTSFVGLD